MLFVKFPLNLLLLLFFGLAFGVSATAVEKIPVPPESASQSQLAAQTAEISELKKLLVQAADDKRKAEDDTRKAEITSLKEQVQAATNNSQKAADWWINATGVVLTIFGLLVTVVGVFAPWWFTRRQKQDLENQEIQTKEHLNKAEALVAKLAGYTSQGLASANKLDELVKAANTDPSKVSPGSAEALTLQNALAGISDEEQEKQPIEVRLKLNALEAQAKNKWLDALSFWQQLLDKQPDNTDALIGLASAQNAFATQQSSPELQNKYYEFAIENFKRTTSKLQGLELANVQNRLGNTLAKLGQRENGTALLEAAVNAYQAALQERTRDRVPLDWAATQNNLGIAMQTIGERENDTSCLEAAVYAYKEALKESTRESTPLDWAKTHNNLGNALKILGDKENARPRLEAAVNAYHEALKEFTRERVPLDWAATQNNLGNALSRLGEQEKSSEWLEAAVIAYQEALKESTRDRVPLAWAMIQNNLGTVLTVLGEREKDRYKGVKLLEEAVESFKNAISEDGKLPDSYALGRDERNLKRVKEALAKKRGE